MISVWEAQISMALPAEFARILHGLIPFGGRIEVGCAAGIMRVMAGSAGHIGPFSRVRDRRVSREFPVGGGKEVGHSLWLAHAPICQHRSWSVAGNAILGILPVDHVVGSLSAARRAQLLCYIRLGGGVFAARPGIVRLMISTRDK